MTPTAPYSLFITFFIASLIIFGTLSPALGADPATMFRANPRHTGVYNVNDLNLSSVTWVYTTGSYVVPSPAIANGVVYVGSNDNNLYAIGTTSSRTHQALSPSSTPLASKTPSSTASSSSVSAIMPLVNFEVSVINFFVPGFEMLTEIVGNALG